MTPERDEPHQTLLIGPGLDPVGPGRGADWSAEEPAAPRTEGRRLVTRLIVAFVILVVVAVLCYGVLPRFGVDLPSWVPLAAFAIIAVGVVANATSEGQFGPSDEDEACRSGDVFDRKCGAGGPDGRPVGCCPGPRPPRFLSDPPRR